MKNLLFLYFLLFTPIICFGQDKQQDKHIKFRDVELKGHVLDFVSELQKLDYTLTSIDKEGSTVIMKGKFIGRDCELYILASARTKTVWKVAVYFDKSNNWPFLKTDYTTLKEQISEKYKKPVKSFEFFSKPYADGDGHELQALKKDKCTYSTYWKLNEGFVKLSITSFCQISIGYEDKINSAIDSSELGREL